LSAHLDYLSRGDVKKAGDSHGVMRKEGKEMRTPAAHAGPGADGNFCAAQEKACILHFSIYPKPLEESENNGNRKAFVCQ